MSKRDAMDVLGNIVSYQTGSLDPSTANPYLAPSFVSGRADTVPPDAGFSTYAPGPSVGGPTWIPSVSGIGVQSSDATGGPAGGAAINPMLLAVVAVGIGYLLIKRGRV